MDLFIEILNLSLVSSYVIVFVLLARLLLKKAPKIYSYMLWGVVFVRLTCSFTFELPVGLIPESQPIPVEVIYQPLSTDNIQINQVSNLSQDFPAITELELQPTHTQSFMDIMLYIWAVGVVLMLGYSFILYVKLKRNLIGSLLISDNIYVSDYITSPFVIDIIKPKIYIPSDVQASELDYIIAHEKTHIKRYDHITRVIAFTILSVHWFNPLVWIAYILSGKDMELSCDEAVIKQTQSDIRKEYSQSLLNFATGRAISTPAFGVNITIDTKERIRNIMKFKKPATWVSALAITSVTALSIGCMTTTSADDNLPMRVVLSEENALITINETNPRVSLSFEDIEISMVNYDNLLYKTNNSESINLDEISLSIAGKEIYLGEQNEGRIGCYFDVDGTTMYSIGINTDINLPSDYDSSQGIVTGEAIALSFTLDETGINIIFNETSSYFDDIITTDDIVKLTLEVYNYAKAEYVEPTNPTSQRITIEKDGIVLSIANTSLFSSDLFFAEGDRITMLPQDVELSINGKDIYLGESNNTQFSCLSNGGTQEFSFHITPDIEGEYIVHSFWVDSEGNITRTDNAISEYFEELITLEDIEQLCMNIYEFSKTQTENTIFMESSYGGEVGIFELDETETTDKPRLNFEKDGMFISTVITSDLVNILDVYTTISLEDLQLNINGENVRLGDQNYGYIYAIDYDDSYSITMRLFTDINLPNDYDPLLGELSGESILYSFVVDKADGTIITYKNEIDSYFDDIITTNDIEKFCMNFYEVVKTQTDSTNSVENSQVQIVEMASEYIQIPNDDYLILIENTQDLIRKTGENSSDLSITLKNLKVSGLNGSVIDLGEKNEGNLYYPSEYNILALNLITDVNHEMVGVQGSIAGEQISIDYDLSKNTVIRNESTEYYGDDSDLIAEVISSIYEYAKTLI